MGVLTDLQDNQIITNRGKIIVNPAFDIVLETQKLYLEDSLTDYEKAERRLECLLGTDGIYGYTHRRRR